MEAGKFMLATDFEDISAPELFDLMYCVELINALTRSVTTAGT